MIGKPVFHINLLCSLKEENQNAGCVEVELGSAVEHKSDRT